MSANLRFAVLIAFTAIVQLASAPAAGPRDYIFFIKYNDPTSFSNIATWNDAQSFCQREYDSDLATLTTKAEMHIAQNYSYYYGGYVGLTKQFSNNDEAQWLWVDGTSCEFAASTNPKHCSDFLQSNPNYNSTLNTTKAFCSIISRADSARPVIYDFDCNASQYRFLTPFLCNKVRGYYYVPDAMTHSQAENYCQSEYDTHLATVEWYDVDNVNDAIVAELASLHLWVGLVPSNVSETGNIWLDGTEYNEYKELVELDDISPCRSLDTDEQIIIDTDSCGTALPFLCNKRAKPREYIYHEVSSLYFNQADADAFCASEYGTNLATITTEEELSDILRLIPSPVAAHDPLFHYSTRNAWIGLKETNGKMKWTDGTDCVLDESQSDLCVPFVWDFGWEPVRALDISVTDSVCVAVWDAGLLRAVPCNSSVPAFVCNAPAPISTDIVMAETETNESDSLVVQIGVAGYTLVKDINDTNETIPPYFGFNDIQFSDPEEDDNPIDRYYWFGWDYSTDKSAVELSNINNLYSDMNAWNQAINKNATKQHVGIGNFISCQQETNEFCLHKIGPPHWLNTSATQAVSKWFPSAIHTEWNLSKIVTVRENDTSWRQDIVVRLEYLTITTANHTGANEMSRAAEQLFPSQSGWSIRHSRFDRLSNSSFGHMSLRYRELEMVVADWGNPNDWEARYNGGHYWEVVENGVVVYLFGLQASCPNQTIRDRLMTYYGSNEPNVSTVSSTEDTETTVVERKAEQATERGEGVPDDQVWVFVGIVFIVLFVLAMCVVVYLIWDLYMRSKPKERIQMQAGYQQTAANEKEVQMTHTNEDEDLLPVNYV